MKCPSDEQLLLFVLGELSVNESEAVARHRAACADCRAALRERTELLSDLRATPELESSEDEFTRRVLARRDRQQSPGSSSRSTRGWARALAVSLVAAAALFALLPRFETELAMHSQADHGQPRGTTTAGLAAEPFAELFRVRDGVFTPLGEAALTAGDAIAVRCSNAGDEPVRLLVFALDAESTVHWLYPAYLDAATNPESITIAARTRDRLLDEMVEPEAPRAGALRVFALFSRAPLTVADIEAHRAELALTTLPAFLGGARVQRWSTTWNER